MWPTITVLQRHSSALALIRQLPINEPRILVPPSAKCYYSQKSGLYKSANLL
jgi:hypothetical protein